MRFNSHSFFRNLFLLVALISSLLLTACGGGGGGGGSAPAPATSNVTVTIPGSLLTQPSGNERAATDEKSIDYKLKVVAYSKGVKKTDVKIDDRQLTNNGTDYVANVEGLVNAYDYRFIAFYKDTEILSNQIALSELTNGANIPVNIDTSLKTLAYDSWKSESPSNASVENFKKNCEKSGLSKDKDFQKLYDLDSYKQNLEQIIKGDKASLPTKADIDTTMVPTTDLVTPLTDIEKALIGKWYLNYSDKFHVIPDSEGNVFTREFGKDHTFTDTSYYPIYDDESESISVSVRTSIKPKNGLRLSSNNEIHIATGTWSYESGKLNFKYTDGNKKNDYGEVGTNVVLNNNSLTFTVHWKNEYEEGSADLFFKKTKWSTYTEPASATKAIVGTWNLYSKNGQVIDSNTEMVSWEFNSDHSCKLPFEFTNGNDKSSNKGTWYYDFGVVYFIPSWGNRFDELFIGEFDLSKQTFSWSSYDEYGNEVVDVYKKTGSNQPSTPTTINQDLVGTWYLNYEDGMPVHTNSNGEVDTITFKSDGTVVWKEFDLTDYGHSSYWEPEGVADTVTGKWSYSNGKLTTSIEGYTMNFPITLKNGELTLTGTEPETWTSVYKKTKYSL